MHTDPLRLQRRAFLGSMLAIAVPRAGAAPSSVLRDYGAAPEFAGIEQWMNSPPLTVAGLSGKVLLVDFWTYSCINCVRTLPHVNRWAQTYKARGLEVVGVHTPEYPFERSTGNVRTAMQRLGVQHPVAQDNRYATWRAYDNRYWPAIYLVDAGGRIRFTHFGEGRYAETEAAIKELLSSATTTPRKS